MHCQVALDTTKTEYTGIFDTYVNASMRAADAKTSKVKKNLLVEALNEMMVHAKLLRDRKAAALDWTAWDFLSDAELHAACAHILVELQSNVNSITLPSDPTLIGLFSSEYFVDSANTVALTSFIQSLAALGVVHMPR